MLRSAIAGVTIAATLAGCGGAGDKAPTQPATGGVAPMLSTIRIDAPSSSVEVGRTVQIVASPFDQFGQAIAVTVNWQSGNAFATVSGAGLATGVASGPALITASVTEGARTISNSVTINVIPRWAGPPPPHNVLVNDPGRTRSPDIQHEPSVAVFGARIVVGWNDGGISLGQTVRGVASGVGYGFSIDGGATFTDAGEVGSSHWGADPSVAVDRAGNFYFGRFDFVPGSFTLDRIAVFKSTDGGATFPQSATAGSSAGSSELVDKPLITADNTGGASDGNIYASWTNATLNFLTVRFARSTDGGASFSPPLQLSTDGNDQGSMPAIGPNGEVYVVWINRGTGDVFVRKSTDGGVSFAPAARVATVAPIGETESETAQYCGRVLSGSIRVWSPPIIAVDRSGSAANGRLYVAFASHGTGGDRADVYLTSSQDDGATWSAPSRLNDDATANDQWYPFVAVAPNGSVAVSWYDRRLDDQNTLIDVFLRISPAGGASFGPNLKITDVSFPPRGVIRSTGFPPYTCYLGSYNWIAADAAHFYLVWTDNRMVTAGTVDPNIMFAKVPY